MLFALFLVCAIDLAIAAVLLFVVGARLRHSARIFGVLLVLAVAFAGGQAADALWPMRASVVEGADVSMAVIGLIVVATRPVWNAFGQLFSAAYLAAALTYLVFAADVTLFGHLSIEGEAASAALFLLEIQPSPSRAADPERFGRMTGARAECQEKPAVGTDALLLGLADQRGHHFLLC